MSQIDVPMGASPWSFRLPDSRLVSMPTRAFPGEPIVDVRAAVRTALDHPLRLEFPLSRAMTSDDRIALVVDEQLPLLGKLVTSVLEYLAGIGIGPESVTILTAPGAQSADWIDDLPDAFADVHTEGHQPDDRKLLSYLATTKEGRRVYLNRTLVDADQIISISGRRYDPLLGYAGGAASLYPSLSDTDTRRALSERLTMEAPSPQPSKIRDEVAEIAWLLGSPIFIQVIEGAGDDLAAVMAGLVDSVSDGIVRLDDRWRFTLPDPVDIVLASIGGHAGRQTFDSLARAAAAASRAVKADGSIVLLTEAEPVLGEGMELLRQGEDFSRGLKLLAEKKPVDRAAAFQWINAATHARLYLASGLRPDLIEELFATPILSPSEVQRLLDQGGTCLYLPDAEKSLVGVEG